MEKIVEICCGSYEDAMASYRGGAKRIELNSALHLGGLTPSMASLILTKQNTDLKVITMIRPRGAGFFYSDEEFACMLLDAKMMMENGADGVAFGCLDQDGHIDVDKTKQMIELVHHYHGEVVFHRAFDCVDDYRQAIELLIDLGVDRVLTSGICNKAVDGMDILQTLNQDYGKHIEILAGSGINATNAKSLMEQTGISQVHSSCKSWKYDPTTSGKNVSYSYGNTPHENDYDVVDETLVRELIKSL